MANKCEETWDYLERFDIVGLTETWMEEEAWRKMCNKVSNKYNWFCISATRENVKGRTKGGIVVAINKEIKEIRVRELNKEMIEVCFGHNNRWRIIVMYSRNIGESLECLFEEVKEEEEEYLIVGGDFNARTGCEGAPIGTGKWSEEQVRKSGGSK